MGWSIISKPILGQLWLASWRKMARDAVLGAALFQESVPSALDQTQISLGFQPSHLRRGKIQRAKIDASRGLAAYSLFQTVDPTAGKRGPPCHQLGPKPQFISNKMLLLDVDLSVCVFLVGWGVAWGS